MMNKKMMNKKIIIMGNTIAAQIIYAILEKDYPGEVVAFSVNVLFINQNVLLDKPVVPFENLINIYPPTHFKLINAVGYKDLNRTREFIFYEGKKLGYEFMTYINKQATILSDHIGEGVFIMPSVVVEPYAVIDNNAVIWSNSVIAHHAVINENCWIASGTVVAGHARIGRNSFLGVNATVVNEIEVGDYNIIGAGALITKNTANKEVFLARSGEKHRFDSHNYATYYGM